MHAAYALLVDSFDAPLLLDYRPHTVAAGCIHVTAMSLEYNLPSSTSEYLYIHAYINIYTATVACIHATAMSLKNNVPSSASECTYTHMHT